jgi:integrase
VPRYSRKTRELARKLFVAVLRWTGLRIRDVAYLKRDRIKNSRLLLRAHKNKKMVTIPLHSKMSSALEALVGKGEFLFWGGEGKPKSAVSDWQRIPTRLGKAANVHVHAPRFRHTLAVELLSKGISIADVAASWAIRRGSSKSRTGIGFSKGNRHSIKLSRRSGNKNCHSRESLDVRAAS